MMNQQQTAPSIHIRDVTLRYNDSNEPILNALNMDIPPSKWTCILGRSGCGKSSLLRYLANLLETKVQFSGTLSTNTKTDLKGQVAYMAQQDLLMPWLTVLENVLLSEKFSINTKKSQNDKKQQINKAKQLLQQVGLADKAALLPQQLSGGMRQRVALARTLMQKKSIVLMDEPFSALDAVTRYRLQNLACELLKDKTVVLITHDPQEAIRLADQLYIMQGNPAFAEQLTLPATATPRNSDAHSATLQQTIIERLEADYE
jgi:putative hydroxymethylpyrimidine transport system ATP-binding protein